MEKFVFLLIFVLIALGQLLFRWLSAYASRQEQQRQPRGSTPVPERAERRDEGVGWSGERDVRPPLVRGPQGPSPRLASRPGPLFAPLPPGPVARPARLASLTELRRTVVLMEILGPGRGTVPMARPGGD